jgi:hypothetical protein
MSQNLTGRLTLEIVILFQTALKVFNVILCVARGDVTKEFTKYHECFVLFLYHSCFMKLALPDYLVLGLVMVFYASCSHANHNVIHLFLVLP